MAARVVRWRRDDGVRHGLAGEPGRKYVPVVVVDYPVRLLKVPLYEQRYMTELDQPSVKKAVRDILKAGRRLGITEGAKRWLCEIRASANQAT